MIRTVLAIFIAVFMIGCKTDNHTRLFFNPSRMFDSEKIHFNVKLNGREILDTIIENDHVDKSHHLRDFYLRNDKKNVLTFKVNNKEKSVNLDQGCLDIFIFYDDHTVINQMAMKIENTRISTGLLVDYKQIVDSLKKTSKIGFYDKIEVDVKAKNCKE